MTRRVFCLHGFLGLPSDWDSLKAPQDFEIEKADIFKIASPANGTSMFEWADAFHQHVRARSQKIPGAGEKRILLGYSMGGRLALHALVQNPSLWSTAVIVSANPTPLSDERGPRAVADEDWARRFETEHWESLVSVWENHPVFGGKPIPFSRKEKDFTRADLAGAFRAWSLARQEDLTPRLLELKIPILWITGNQDPRYQEIARRLKSQAQGKTIEFVSVEGSGHRVPWEKPDVFHSHFSSFLERVF
jgi:2-succinyl-6-hydroxy-2,4-cyclohexadiene-1-carboxylate synthase